jgi:hypothetical protein
MSLATFARPDRAAHYGANPLQNASLHFAPQLHRGKKRTLAAHEAAGHFVDGENRRHRQAAFDGLHDAVMVFRVNLVTPLDQNDLRAHPFGVGDDGSRSDAEGLGLIARGNAAGSVGHHGNNAYRPPAQFGAHLLLHRSKIGVQIDKKPIHVRPGRLLRGSQRRRVLRDLELLRPFLFWEDLFRILAGSHITFSFAFYSL